MRILVEASWDDDARVWVASSVGDLGLVTEADTIEALQRKIAMMVPDLLDGEQSEPFEVELVARSLLTIAA